MLAVALLGLALADPRAGDAPSPAHAPSPALAPAPAPVAAPAKRPAPTKCAEVAPVAGPLAGHFAGVPMAGRVAYVHEMSVTIGSPVRGYGLALLAPDPARVGCPTLDGPLTVLLTFDARPDEVAGAQVLDGLALYRDEDPVPFEDRALSGARATLTRDPADPKRGTVTLHACVNGPRGGYASGEAPVVFCE